MVKRARNGYVTVEPGPQPEDRGGTRLSRNPIWAALQKVRPALLRATKYEYVPVSLVSQCSRLIRSLIRSAYIEVTCTAQSVRRESSYTRPTATRYSLGSYIVDRTRSIGAADESNRESTMDNPVTKRCEKVRPKSVRLLATPDVRRATTLATAILTDRPSRVRSRPNAPRDTRLATRDTSTCTDRTGTTGTGTGTGTGAVPAPVPAPVPGPVPGPVVPVPVTVHFRPTVKNTSC